MSCIKRLAIGQVVYTLRPNCSTGGTVKTTPYMVGRWVKACFLLFVGIVVLLYADKFVHELRVNAETHYELAFDWTWTLITWLLWILVAWLFVDAGLTVALSFTEQKHTIGDVAKRLERIEDKLGIEEKDLTEQPSEAQAEAANLIEEPSEETVKAVEEVPPPPRE